MGDLTVFDFEHADIEKLAVHLTTHLGRLPAHAEPGILSAGGQIIYTGQGILYGWSLTNTDGAAANTVTVFDGANANGNLLAEDTVAASASSLRWIGLPGVKIDRGLFVTGTTTGTAILYVGRHPARH